MLIAYSNLNMTKEIETYVVIYFYPDFYSLSTFNFWFYLQFS